jgi:hypothetical protein
MRGAEKNKHGGRKKMVISNTINATHKATVPQKG